MLDFLEKPMYDFRGKNGSLSVVLIIEGFEPKKGFYTFKDFSRRTSEEPLRVLDFLKVYPKKVNVFRLRHKKRGGWWSGLKSSKKKGFLGGFFP